MHFATSPPGGVREKRCDSVIFVSLLEISPVPLVRPDGLFWDFAYPLLTCGVAVRVFHTRSAVILMSSVPWHAPLRISVCMVPESDPSGWGV
jgi:hypothetical protein